MSRRPKRREMKILQRRHTRDQGIKEIKRLAYELHSELKNDSSKQPEINTEALHEARKGHDKEDANQ